MVFMALLFIFDQPTMVDLLGRSNKANNISGGVFLKSSVKLSFKIFFKRV